MVIPDLGHITFVLVVECHEILHELRTTGNIQVGIIRHRGTLEHLVLPVYVRITFCLAVVTEEVAVGIIVRLNSTVLIAEVVDEGLWTIVCPRSVTTDGKLVFERLVTKHIAIVRVILTRQL